MKIGDIRVDGKKKWELMACHRCGGSGIYTEYHGVCFRCNGVGHTDKDWYRIDEEAVKNRERYAKRKLEKELKKREEAKEVLASRLHELGVYNEVAVLFHEDDLGGAVAGFDKLPIYMEDIELAKEGWSKEDMDREDLRRFVGDVVDDLTPYDVNCVSRDVWTIIDIVRKIGDKGKVSEKAETFLINLVERLKTVGDLAAKRKEERLAKEDVPTGKVTITGEVLSVKFKDNGFGGGNLKGLILDDRGFKVWGTISSKMTGSVEGGVVGHRFTFEATVEASPDDPKFGFYKRPSKVKKL